MKHAGLYYPSNPHYPCLNEYALRFSGAVMPHPPHVNEAHAISPGFEALNYLSLTDCYTSLYTGEEHPDGAELRQIGVDFDIPEEDLYLHWAEDTVVSYWAGTQLHYPAGSRVEVYYNGHQNAGTRHAVAHTEEARPAHIQRVGNRLLPIYAGIFLDNTAHILENWGSPLISGGTVAEAGVKINSLEFRAWHWASVRATLVALMTNFPSWRIAPNVANLWNDSYLDDPICATDIIQESVGNPLREWAPIPTQAARHVRALQQGINLWSSANPQLSGGGETISYDDMAMGCTALHLVLQRNTSFLNIQNWTGPTVPNWMDTVIWRGERTELFKDLGAPAGEPYLSRAGSSPRGNPYKIHARPYEKGLALARIANPQFSGVLDDVYIDRPRQTVWLRPDGTPSKQALIPIHNGGGAILRAIV